ncbi:MAG: GreA/GreB family elongation factor, partial [Chloroflexi bacterium]|nr:GreA/GreB family elongation factor [Chloroflexota bacterium]
VTVRLFQAANEVGHPDFPDKTLRAEWLGQVRRTVSGREFAFLKDILDHTDAGWAKEIRTSVSRNSGLTDHLRIQVLEVIGHAHPVPVAPTVPPWLEENTVYSTAAALEARQKEFEHLVHVKMVENSTAIGEAAAQGDLSENAEFTAALEERDRMTERANAMQADIARAKTISRLMAESRTVNIGSRVEGRRLSTGQAETLTFLGPWDANTAKGIYYYRAPLAQAFMGKAVGDTVTLQTGTVQEQWEVLEIASAI